MGAAQNQGIHPGVPDPGKVLGNDQTGHLLLFRVAVVHIPGFHQRDEQRASPGRDLHTGHQLAQKGLVTAGPDGRRRADDADAAVAGGKGCFPGGGIHHAQIGHRQCSRFRGRVGAGHRAAGCHDALDILGQQKGNVLPGILQDGLRTAAAIRHPAGIAEVDDVFMGQAPAQFPHAGQAAKAAVKYADGAVIHAAFPSFPEPARSGDRSGPAPAAPRAPSVWGTY